MISYSLPQSRVDFCPADQKSNVSVYRDRGIIMSTPEKKAYTYYAFISYSRKDEEWAKWLQKRLETYRIPSIIRKQNLNIPQKLSPVFRDKTDLTGGRLLEVLHEELDNSQYLIVICSPNSAGSQWVDKEILHFIQQGREAYIIPFIVDGELMAADPALECYPEALRAEPESEILGISVRELGKEKAFLRVVAALLNLKFDQIVMRDRKRRVKQRAFAAAACLCFLIGSLAGIWYYMPHSAYYEDFVWRYEVPQGLRPLSRGERMGKAVYCRIVSRQGKIVRLELLNSMGKPMQLAEIASEDSYASIDFFYEGKQLSRAELRDAADGLVFVKDYSSNLKAVDFQKSDDSSQAFVLSTSESGYGMTGASNGRKSEITRFINTYDENGYLIEKRFMRDSRNTPIADNNGNYGLRYEIDAKGQITSVTGLDENGNPHNSKYGYAMYVYSFDENGWMTACEYFNADGKKVKNESGYCRMETAYDKSGNISCRKYLDEHGALCNIKGGYAQEEMRYTEQGFMAEMYVLDTDGNPTYSKEEGCHAYRYTYDEQGNMECIEFFDTEMRPACNNEGYSSLKYIYDDKGRVKEVFYFGIDGEPACEKDSGCFGMLHQWDDNGRNICDTCVDAEHHPIMSRYGYASVKTEYDSIGNVIKQSYYDADGKAIRNRENYASVEFEDDGVGKLTKIIYRDEQGNRCMKTGGYAELAYTYDNRGNLASEKFYDAEGNPVIGSGGYHEYQMEYDDYGNFIKGKYCDAAGNLQVNSEGFAFAEYRYDEYGNMLECSYYDEAGQSIQAGGFSRNCWEYDARGNMVREEKYRFATDTEDEKFSAFIAVYEYDDRDNQIKATFFDEKGQSDVIAYLYTYDDKNRVISKLLHVGKKSVMTTKYEYNERNQLIRESYYPVVGTTSEEMTDQIWYSYDDFGNLVRTEYQDADGKLKICDSGFAVIKSGYNKTGDLVETAYYDENGNLCMHENGNLPLRYARLKVDFDSQGNRIREMYYDQNDHLIEHYEYEFNSQGWMMSQTRVDEEGNQLDREGKPGRIEFQYDKSGRETRRTYYDSEGKEYILAESLVAISEVTDGSQAAQAGIQPGDLLLKYCQWELFDYDDFTEASYMLSQVIQENMDREKVLVIGRENEEEADWEFCAIDLGPGTAGILMWDESCTAEKIESVREQYRKWKEKNIFRALGFL